MRLYGALSELAELIIRLASGKTVKVSASEQTAAGETIVTIPNVVDGADEFVMKDTQQSLTKKTLSGSVTTAPNTNKTSDTVISSADITANKIVIPTLLNNTDRPGDRVVEGALHWSSDDKLWIGDGSGFKVVVDEASSQTLFNKTLSNPGISGGIISSAVLGVNLAPVTVNNVDKIQINPGIAGTGNNHVAITNASGELVTEAQLAKSRGGIGADATNITFPASGVLVTEAGSQTLSNKTIGSVTAQSGVLSVVGTGALRLPLGTDAQKPAGTAADLKGMIRYNDEQDAFEGYNELSGWSALGGGGTTDRVTQASHGFVVGDVLWLNGPTYAKAQANAANTAEVVGMVSRIIDASTFELTLSGEVSGLTGLVAGEVYFLSASTAGALTVTEPSVVGQVSLPVGVASSATTLYVAPKRGVVVGAANARTTIAVANNSATNVVSVTNYNSLKLEGELNVTRSAGGNQRAYYTVEAAKNGAGVWQVSASYTGDDVLYTTLPSWDVASSQLQVTMPLVTNFTSASLTYALNAPAVGASLPLSIDSSALNIVADAPLSYRNRIINGDMRIDQRNSGASVTQQTGALFPVDRFRVLGSVSSKFTAQQNAGSVTPPAGYTNYLGMTSSAATTVGASDYYLLQHNIEGLNVADLAWGTANAQAITLSFWARSSLTGTHSGSLQNNAGDRSYAFSYTINAANTWEQKTVTIPGDTTGTWLTNSGLGIKINWNLGSGSTFTTAANSWAAGNFFGANSSVNVVGTNGATFYLTGVQLEVGSKASAFERRPYGMELQLCQRYLPVMNAAGTGKVLAMGQAIGATSAIIVFPFSVTPRVIPTSIQGAISASSYSVSGSTGNSIVSTAVNYVAATNLSAGIINVTVASGLVAGNATYMFGDVNINWLGCEL